MIQVLITTVARIDLHGNSTVSVHTIVTEHPNKKEANNAIAVLDSRARNLKAAGIMQMGVILGGTDE